MTFDEYQIAAGRTINKKLTYEEKILDGVMGMCGEAGEASELVKKWKWQGHALTPAHLVNELGDVLWYVAEICATLGISMEDVARKNVTKLQARYPEGFSSEASIHREAEQ